MPKEFTAGEIFEMYRITDLTSQKESTGQEFLPSDEEDTPAQSVLMPKPCRAKGPTP